MTSRKCNLSTKELSDEGPRVNGNVFWGWRAWFRAKIDSRFVHEGEASAAFHVLVV